MFVIHQKYYKGSKKKRNYKLPQLSMILLLGFSDNKFVPVGC
jgi:hypothetical protein